jgi:hypothetical protein
MSKTQADYYLDNPNARLVALMRRVAALERRLGIVAPQMEGQEGAAVTMPSRPLISGMPVTAPKRTTSPTARVLTAVTTAATALLMAVMLIFDPGVPEM